MQNQEMFANTKVLKSTHSNVLHRDITNVFIEYVCGKSYKALLEVEDVCKEFEKNAQYFVHDVFPAHFKEKKHIEQNDDNALIFIGFFYRCLNRKCTKKDEELSFFHLFNMDKEKLRNALKFELI